MQKIGGETNLADKIKGITIEIGGETTGLSKAMKQVNGEARSLQNELNQVNRLLKLDPKNTELLAQKQKLLSESVKGAKTSLDALKKAKADADETMKNGGEVNENQYRQLQREIVKAEQNLKSLEDQAKSFGSIGTQKLKEIGKSISDFGGKITDAGKKASVASGAIGAIGAGAQAAFSEVDGALDTIITKTGATSDAAEAMGDVFKDVYGDMPVDAQAVGDAIGELNTQFAFTGDALKKSTKQMLKFAEINGSDVTITSQKAKAAIEAYGLEAKDLDLVLDSITKTSQNTGVATDQLFDAVVKGAPQIKALGLNFSEAAALVGRFEQKGIDGTKALSYLSKAQVTFAKSGKSLQKGLQDLSKKLENSKSDTEKLKIASETFGTKGAPVMLDALKRGALKLDDFKNAAKDASGVVSSTFDATLDPVDKNKVAMNNLKLAGNELSAAFQETLAPVIEKVVDKLKKFREWFEKLSPDAKKAITIIGLVVAAIGPLLVVLGGAVSGFGAIVGAIGALSAPVVLTIAAIGGVIAAVVLMYNKCEWFRNGVKGIMDSIKELWKNFTATLKNLWENGGLKEAWEAVWKIIQEVFKQIIDSIKTTFDFWIKIFSGDWQGAWNVLKDFFQRTWERIKNICVTVLDGVKNAFNNIINWFKDIFTKDWTKQFKVIGSILNSFGKSVGDIVSGIQKTFNGVIDFIKNVFTGNWKGAWNAVKDIFKGVFDSLYGIVKTPINGIIGLLNSAINGINFLLKGLNKIRISIPSWVPEIGGNSFGINIPEIPHIPLLAKGGVVRNGGDAIVGEAGAEYLQVRNGRAIVTPMNGKSSSGVNLTMNFLKTQSSPYRVAEETRRSIHRLALSGVL